MPDSIDWDALRAAARSLCRVMLDTTSRDARALRQAGGLLAEADDPESLRVAFARFAYLARAAGDVERIGNLLARACRRTGQSRSVGCKATASRA